MRKPDNCAHAFQEVKNKGKKRLQFCMDCGKNLYKWQNEQKVGNQVEQTPDLVHIDPSTMVEFQFFSKESRLKNTEK